MPKEGIPTIEKSVEEGVESKAEKTESKEEKIQRLKQQVESWIKIFQSNIDVEYNLPAGADIDSVQKRIERAGADAPRNLVEDYNRRRKGIEFNNWKIEELRKFLEALNNGEDTIFRPPISKDIEPEMIEIINAK